MIIVGIDEVGRGCWAGPLVAGAVILTEPISGLKDSKKMTKKQREKVAIVIYEEALAVGLGWVDAQTIDEVGVSAAVKMAMQAALRQIKVGYDQVIIDGNINYLSQNSKSQAIIKADDFVPSVSAASILAKVARDNFMTEKAKVYPGYGFEKHVGYGTAQHIQQLNKLGITNLHRRSFKPVQVAMAA